MSVYARKRILVGIAVAIIAASGWIVATTNRDQTDRAFAQRIAGEEMLIHMLNQQTGLRGFLLTGRESFLEPHYDGRRDFALAGRDALAATDDGSAADLSVRRQLAIAEPWQRLADREISQVRVNGPERGRESLQVARERLFNRFRAEHERFERMMEDVRADALDAAQRLPVMVMVALSLIFGGIGYFLIERGARHARRRYHEDTEIRTAQEDFTETLQAMRNEGEAHTLVKLHLERSFPGAEVAVLNRNNSDDRLEAATQVRPDDPLTEGLIGATPESCVAVRLGRTHEQGEGSDPLLHCEVCGRSGRQALCSPSLVGGEVIGSVLVESDRKLGEGERERVQQSVGQAAPVLANLRNLALAEMRAATDQLTGLPNKRSVDDSLKRMVAQAGRAHGRLAAILLDLDHFKQINDIHGHGAGDDVLAAVGATIPGALRAGDFAGRYGGEEFVLLLPDTDRAGAVTAAEALRSELERIRIPGVDRAVTASLGVAVLPEDAADADGLLRMADRALYAAKASGRNRVHVAEPPGSGHEEPHLT